MKKLILLISITLGCNCVVKSQLYLKNNTNEPVQVASVSYEETKNMECWTSWAWYIIQPGETGIIGVVGDRQSVYYYAKSTISEKEYTGDYSFLVSDKALQIQNADMDYVLTQNPTYYWKKFRKITACVSKLCLKYTIELNN